MSRDASLFSTLTKYEGANSVMIGNGQFLPISHIGSVQIRTSRGFISLNNVLVPLLIQNLLSISRLTADSPLYYSLFF